ncbi:MAG: radical SAM protein [Burkholderiales bacterium]|nr:radical SAM protein [Burkholderiales bacterium]
MNENYQSPLPDASAPAPHGRPVRLLLINPRFPESFWSFRWAVQEILPRKRAVNPPLGLATLAALCPPHWEVTIVDENVESVPLAPQTDLVGVCGMGVQFPRQKELLAYYRGKGYRVVAGGSYASLCPEAYAEHADTVVCGEAEYIWPEFCRDFESGAVRALYRETGTVSLEDSPVPRLDLLKLEAYTTATLQFSRGCPYRCEFCDIIVMFGRKPRFKRPEQVGRELDELRKRGVRSVFFVDDNLIGNKAAAKTLLRYLADYQRRHGWRFAFGTEASINLAQDAELLGLFRDANFEWVFIGIESPDAESLRETRKTQNMQEDALTSVRRIHAHGLDVLAGFIVGFDNDTLDAFDRQYRFIVDAGIQAAMVGLLKALPKTPLWERLEREGRLIPDDAHSDNCKLGTNVMPKRMSYDAMVSGYRELYERLLADRAIADKIRAKLAHMERPMYHGTYGTRDSALIVWRLAVKGLLPGGPRRLYHFFRSLPLSAPRKIPQAILDWVAALAMGDYVRRHFGASVAAQAAAADRLGNALSRAIARYLREGKVALTWLGGDRAGGDDAVAATPQQATASETARGWTGRLPALQIALKDWPDQRFFARAARPVERVLRRTSATLTLRIEAFREQERRHLERLLRRLARHGDRISIVVSEGLRELVHVDSSRFHLVLAGAPGATPEGSATSP